MHATQSNLQDDTAVTATHRTSVGSILKTLAMASSVAISLLSFPSVLPVMVACWIAWHTILVGVGRPGWLPLVACLAILVVKFVPPTPAMLLLGASLLIVAGLRFYASSRENAFGKLMWPASLALWVAWGLMSYQWHTAANTSRSPQLDPTRPIVCLGDSLTEGMLPDHGYPEQLREMIRVPVVNLGFSGITTAQGLGQLDRVLSHQPQVVVIELGGHDFLRGHSRSETKANLVQMIERCRQEDAEVILMEIPRGFMFDPYRSLEREIAYQHDVQLVADTWLRQIVIMSPVAPPGMWMPRMQLSDDGIHSNPRGSAVIAKRVAAALSAIYGDDVLVK